MPRHTSSDLIQADVASVEQYLPYNAPVSIVLRPLNGYYLVKDCVRKILLALSAECLPLLGRVDT
jgi:hypothetical protein